MGGEEGFLVAFDLMMRREAHSKHGSGTPLGESRRYEVDRWGGARLPATQNGVERTGSPAGLDGRTRSKRFQWQLATYVVKILRRLGLGWAA